MRLSFNYNFVEEIRYFFTESGVEIIEIRKLNKKMWYYNSQIKEANIILDELVKEHRNSKDPIDLPSASRGKGFRNRIIREMKKT